jgi:16S rRNA (guanine(966)-N(2))-methyltransferase RsmD
MRVIGGEFGSRRLKTPTGLATRPTPDRLREAVFNVIAPRLAGTVFLDAYAGSGAMGIEALSRGARKAIFIEKNHAAVRIIRENLAALGIEDRASVIHAQAAPQISRYDADIVFLDPPYELGREYAAALRAIGDSSPQLALVQHPPRVELPEETGPLRRTRVLKHGDNCVSFFEVSLP